MLRYEITAALMSTGRTCGFDGASQTESAQMRGITGLRPINEVKVSVYFFFKVLKPSRHHRRGIPKPRYPVSNGW